MNWYVFRSFNHPNHYGYGTQEEAKAYCEKLNAENDVDLYAWGLVEDEGTIQRLEDDQEWGNLSEGLIPPTLEICCNLEWLRDNAGLNLDSIEECEWNLAAEELQSLLHDKLVLAGFETERAKAGRILFHGWNGYNGFRHKLGPVGTFDVLTKNQQETIWEVIQQCRDDVETTYKANYGGLYDYRTGEYLRPATKEERAVSWAEIEAGSHEGVIPVDWKQEGGWEGEDFRLCYVQE